MPEFWENFAPAEDEWKEDSEHGHEYSHEHGNHPMAMPVEHEHLYSHSHEELGDHDHSLEEHIEEDSEYDPVHDDGTHN